MKDCATNYASWLVKALSQGYLLYWPSGHHLYIALQYGDNELIRSECHFHHSSDMLVFEYYERSFDQTKLALYTTR